MFEKLMPKEIAFFDYFERMAAKILLADTQEKMAPAEAAELRRIEQAYARD